MKFKNEIILIGKIKNSPHTVARQDGTHMSTFSLITEDIQGNAQEHIIIAIGELSTVIEVSGQPQKVIYLRGSLTYSSNDIKRVSRIIAEDIVIVWDGQHYSQRLKS